MKHIKVFAPGTVANLGCGFDVMGLTLDGVGDLLEEFFKRPYVAAKVAEGKLPDTWREIVGDRAADFTTELKLENHILYARIQSSVLRSELFYQREALKEELNRRSGVRIVNAVIIR